MTFPAWFTKKVSAWITYPVLVFFSFFLVGFSLFFYLPKFIQAQTSVLIPFEGKITNIEYNCLCSLSIMLTVQPTPATQQQGAQTVVLMFYYGAQLLEQLGVDFGDLGVLVPRVYLWYMIWSTGNQQLLGNYFPGAFQCWAYAGSGCSVNGEAEGAILHVGTSLY